MLRLPYVKEKTSYLYVTDMVNNIPYDSLKLRFRSTPQKYVLPEIRMAMG